MKFLVFFLLNIILPLSFADPKISIDPTTINNLDESFRYQVNFQLSSPIICENPHVLCNVVMTFTNPEPHEISINPCILEWDRDEWDVTKTITISALEDFVDDGERTITLTTNPLISNAVFYDDVEADDIVTFDPATK